MQPSLSGFRSGIGSNERNLPFSAASGILTCRRCFLRMPDSDEPPIREFADRGILWLLESPENLRGLLALAAEEIAARLDFSRAQRINRSFIPPNLHKEEADLLYEVPFREGAGEAWVYLLLEHQSRPDRTMGLRRLSYMTEIWKTQQRAWEDAKT